MAPQLELISLTGDTMSLKNLAGSVVLIDFWASWCAPCREANKNYRLLYQKYYAKGFKILGVSLDNNSEAWQKAINIDGLHWPQAIMPHSWKNPLVTLWGIRFLPCSYLINNEGKIIAVNPGYGIAESWLKELLENPLD